MIVGLEGIFTSNGITLNDLPSGFPRYRLTGIPGLLGTPDTDWQDEKAFGRTGMVPRKTARGGRSITFEGVIEATDQVMLRQATEDLVAAFQDTVEQRFEAKSHPLWPPEAAIPLRWFYARCDCLPVEDFSEAVLGSVTYGYQRPFSIIARLSDPRYYHEDSIHEVDDTRSPVSGAGVPFTPGGRSGSPSGNGFSITTTNPGTTDSDAQIKINGPIRNPIISNETLDLFLKFRDMTLGDLETVIVDFKRRTAYKEVSGANCRHKIHPNSTWWDRDAKCIVPGENIITLRGWSVDTDAKLVLDYYPADLT